MDKSDFTSLIIKEINYIRSNPIDYAKKLLAYEKYFRGNVLYLPNQTPILTSEGFSAYRETSNFLMRTIPTGPLIINSYLTRIAEDILNSKNDSDEIISKYGKVVGSYSEIIEEGSETVEILILNLLVDDGDSNRNNRNNLLNKSHRIMGISTKNENNIKKSCLTFARRFYSKNEDIGDLSDENYDYTVKHNEEENKQIKEIPIRNDNIAEDDDNFELEKGVIKEDRKEKEIEEGGIRKKIIKITRTYEDGTTHSEINKILI